MQFLTLGHARRLLAAGRPVDTTALAVGLSGSGRLHDLIVQHEALTPGELRRGAAGVPVGWGLAATPFGEALLAWTPRGLGYLAFVDDTPAAALAGCQVVQALQALVERPPTQQPGKLVAEGHLVGLGRAATSMSITMLIITCKALVRMNTCGNIHSRPHSPTNCAACSGMGLRRYCTDRAMKASRNAR